MHHRFKRVTLGNLKKGAALILSGAFLFTWIAQPYAQANGIPSALPLPQMHNSSKAVAPEKFVSILNDYIARLELLKRSEERTAQENLSQLIELLKNRLTFTAPLEREGKEYILGEYWGKERHSYFLLEYAPTSDVSQLRVRNEIKSFNSFRELFDTLRNQTNINSASKQGLLLAEALPALMTHGELTNIETSPDQIEKILVRKIFNGTGNWKLEDIRTKKPIRLSYSIRYQLKNGKVTFYKVEKKQRPTSNAEKVFTKYNSRTRKKSVESYFKAGETQKEVDGILWSKERSQNSGKENISADKDLFLNKFLELYGNRGFELKKAQRKPREKKAVIVDAESLVKVLTVLVILHFMGVGAGGEYTFPLMLFGITQLITTGEGNENLNRVEGVTKNEKMLYILLVKYRALFGGQNYTNLAKGKVLNISFDNSLSTNESEYLGSQLAFKNIVMTAPNIEHDLEKFENESIDGIIGAWNFDKGNEPTPESLKTLAQNINRILNGDGEFLLALDSKNDSSFKQTFRKEGFDVVPLEKKDSIYIYRLKKIKSKEMLVEFKERIVLSKNNGSLNKLEKEFKERSQFFENINPDDFKDLAQRIKKALKIRRDQFTNAPDIFYKLILSRTIDSMEKVIVSQLKLYLTTKKLEEIEHPLHEYLKSLSTQGPRKAVQSYFDLLQIYENGKYKDIDPISSIESGLWDVIYQNHMNRLAELIVNPTDPKRDISRNAEIALTLLYLKTLIEKGAFSRFLGKRSIKQEFSNKKVKEIFERFVRRYITRESINFHALLDQVGNILLQVHFYLDSVRQNIRGDPGLKKAIDSIYQPVKFFMDIWHIDIWNRMDLYGISKLLYSIADTLDQKIPELLEVIEGRELISDYPNRHFLEGEFKLKVVPSILRVQAAFIDLKPENSPMALGKIWDLFEKRIVERNGQGTSWGPDFIKWWHSAILNEKGEQERRIKAQFKDGAEWVNVNIPISLQRVIGEMIKNSGQKNSEKGKDWDTLVQITFSMENDLAVITVEDNGRGIPPEMLKEDPYLKIPVLWTLHGTTSGGGIGMAEAWRLIHDAKGSITADDESQLGGARFIVKIPIKKTNGHTNGLIKPLLFALQISLFLCTGIFIGGIPGSLPAKEPEWKQALQKGLDASKGNNWANAAKFCLEALRLRPPKEAVSAIWRCLAETYLQDKKYKRALEAIRNSENYQYEYKAYLEYLRGAAYFDWGIEAQEQREINKFLNRMHEAVKAFKEALKLNKEAKPEFGLTSIQIKETVESIAKIYIFVGALEELKETEDLLVNQYPVDLENNSARIVLFIGLSAAFLRLNDNASALKILEALFKRDSINIRKVAMEKLEEESTYEEYLSPFLLEIVFGSVNLEIDSHLRNNIKNLILEINRSRPGYVPAETLAKNRLARRELEDLLHKEFSELRIRETVTLGTALFNKGWKEPEIQKLIQEMKLRKLTSERQIKNIVKQIKEGKKGNSLFPFVWLEEYLQETLTLTDQESIYSKIKEMDKLIEELQIDDRSIRLEIRDTYINALTVYLSLVRRIKRQWMIDEAFQIYYKFVTSLTDENFKNLDPLTLYKNGEWGTLQSFARDRLAQLIKTRPTDKDKAVSAYYILAALEYLKNRIESGSLTPEISSDLMRHVSENKETDMVNDILNSAYGFLKYVLPVKIDSHQNGINPEPLTAAMESYFGLASEGNKNSAESKGLFINLIRTIEEHLAPITDKIMKLGLTLNNDEAILLETIEGENGLKIVPKILRFRLSTMALSIFIATLFAPVAYPYIGHSSALAATVTSGGFNPATSSYAAGNKVLVSAQRALSPKHSHSAEDEIMLIAATMGDKLKINKKQKEENERFILNVGDLLGSTHEIRNFLDEMADRSKKYEVVIVTDNLLKTQDEIMELLLKADVSQEEVQQYVRILVQPRVKGKFNLPKLIRDYQLANGYTLRILNKNGLWTLGVLLQYLWKGAFQENRILYIEKSWVGLKLVGYSQ